MILINQEGIMKTKQSIKKLRLGKETISNLNSSQMGLIFGGVFLREDNGEIHPVTYSCNPCYEEGEPVYPNSYTCEWNTCGESCH